MSKDLKFNIEAREQLKQGVDQLANAVKVTLGPKGRNVIIEKKFGAPHITKDGVTVAKEVELSDPFQNTGAQLVKSVASKTGDDAGDGTTTATVLAEYIYKRGIKALTSGINPNQLKRGMDDCVKMISDELKKFAITVDNINQLYQIATISANGDDVIGKVITDAINAVGIDGTVNVSDSKTNETYWDIIKGMEFSNGYLSPYFVNNDSKGSVEFDNPYILLVGKKIGTVSDILPILQ